MESFYLITPIALILIGIAIKLFIWAVNNGQYDDLDREASRILFDDDGDTARDNNDMTKTDQPKHTDSAYVVPRTCSEVKPQDAHPTRKDNS